MTFTSTFRLVVLFSIMIPSSLFGQEEWMRWRGPDGNGIAPGQNPPTTWSAQDNVIWKAKVKGRGHGSPLITESKIFLSTANETEKTQSVACFTQSDGKQLWETVVNEGNFARRIHGKNTHASSTIATDGEYVFTTFGNNGTVQVVALDFGGKKIWSKTTGKYAPPFPFGYGSSPIVYGDVVIVTNEGGKESALIAFDTKTGDEKWKISRTGISSFSTPVIAPINGKEHLLISGGKQVSSYDPNTGKENWSVPALWQVTCGTMVWDNPSKMVFASGGYPANQTLAINAESGKKIWDNPAKVYEQSMLVHEGYLYAHSDNGVIYCWRVTDGKEMWKQKFSERRVAVSASPVLANGNIYFTAENGETVVILATHEGYQEVARNNLGTESFASMAFSNDKIYTRIAESSGGSRQEWLFCLGEKKRQ